MILRGKRCDFMNSVNKIFSNIIDIVVGMIVICIFLNCGIREAYADDNDTNFALKHSIEASIYKTDTYETGGAGEPLTQSGGTINKWLYKDSRYLQIEVNVDAKAFDSQVHVVEVKVETPLYVKNDLTVVPTGFSKVECISNNTTFIINIINHLIKIS